MDIFGSNLQSDQMGPKGLLVFTGTGTVCLTKTYSGRQFGPSVLAPFARVVVLGDVGYVDGFIVARSYYSGDQKASQVRYRAFAAARIGAPVPPCV